MCPSGLFTREVRLPVVRPDWLLERELPDWLLEFVVREVDLPSVLLLPACARVEVLFVDSFITLTFRMKLCPAASVSDVRRP